MIEIKNICRDIYSEYGYKTQILSNISFSIAEEKITGIIAPGKSGKSTLLKIISGLDNPTSGNIENSSQKKIVIIPSKPSSFPWLTVFDNVKFGLKNWSKEDIIDLIASVGLAGYEAFHPDNNSLGFRFRIALARSLAHNPSLILLDEPFNLLDNVARGEIYKLLRKIKRERKTTFLIVTSNISEAVFLSDKIYLMKKDPTEIISEYEADFGSERDLTIYSSPKFTSLRSEIENRFSGLNSQSSINLSI